jgi:predicted NAD/FAD-binding protein
MKQMKIAVIGGGISGLGAAVILGRSHEVHLFEAENRLGGHAHTVQVPESGKPVPMDTGFLVFNELNYPHLTSFFRFLNVKTVDSDMSLSVQVAKNGLEWGGTNLNTIFGQRANLLRPSFYRMLLEIGRFHREAASYVPKAKRHAWTLRDLLTEGKYAREFATFYLLPIGAAIWSTPERDMLEYPAATFLTFFLNHKLLQVSGRPLWKTVAGGSIQYVDKAKELIPHVHSGAEVISVERCRNGVLVSTAEGQALFDCAVLATHAPTTAKLLLNASDEERNILSAIGVVANKAVLHRDSMAMPRTNRCWSAWNVKAGAKNGVSLTYHLNRLHPLMSQQNYFLSLNPELEMSGQIGTYNYNHPRFDQRAIRAQREIPRLQGRGGIYFAGAWTRYGFHEDGLLSAVNVANLIGAIPQWRAA